MLRVINNFANGYVAIPVIVACRKHGLFELLSPIQPMAFADIANLLEANRGYLRASLSLLESLNWVERTDRDEYIRREASEQSMEIPWDIMELMNFPVQDYLLQTGRDLTLRPWIEQSKTRWGHNPPIIGEFLDGLLLVPLLVALHELGCFSGSANGQNESDVWSTGLEELGIWQRSEILELFRQQGWLFTESRSEVYSDAGRFITERVGILATVYSYHRLLANVEELIFGDCTSIFSRDSANRERHVDRTLNVLGSGFQHDKYFSDLDEIILSVFNHEPLAEQPNYIADMGCGNGVLLKHIYETIKEKTLRGRFLAEHPILLIGIDFNEAALEQTKQTLMGLNHVVLQGDIGNPQKVLEDLTRLGVDVKRILHVRSFLDHDRPFLPPVNLERAKSRERMGVQAESVADNGSEIPPSMVVQSLVEHLERWSGIVNEHGLVVLEAHCQDPRTIQQHLDRTESLHFDAYHRFSHQLLVDADTFLVAAAETGLFPKEDSFRKYPKTLPFCRITLNHFERRPYRIRFAEESDLPALVKLEQECWRSELQTPKSVLTERIRKFPEGQLVLEMNKKVVGVLYSQRVPNVDCLRAVSVHTVDTVHDRTGGYVQLLGLNVLPAMQNRNLGHQLLEFMLQRCSIMAGVHAVAGVSRCRDYFKYNKNLDVADYIYQRTQDGQLVDATLRFHESHGAKIQGLLPHYRPQDTENQEYGVLLVYDLRARLWKQAREWQGVFPSTNLLSDLPAKVGLDLDSDLPVASARASSSALPSHTPVTLETPNSVLDFVLEAISALLGESVGSEEVALHQPLMEMGLDSADLLELETQLSQQYGLSLGSSFFFQYNTVGRVVDYLLNTLALQADDSERSQNEPFGDDPVKEYTGIAIVGLACRLPGGVRTGEQLWDILRKGASVTGKLPSGRWEWPLSIHLETEHKGIDEGGFLDRVDEFDPLFFRVSPKEAELMDPQQRILLELSWECLEDAGYSAKDMSGSQTGVFIGASGSDYQRLLGPHLAQVDANYATGTSMAALPNRVSYFYNFHGPSVQIDTACSSSLVAVHQAVQALELGECEQALVGGVHIMCHPHDSLAYYKAGMLSKDGMCRTFDKDANGYVRGEGAVVLLLKPLQRALDNRDEILAVIKGTATNHGGQTSGLTVPSPNRQAAVIVDAFHKGNFSPESVSYIEVHGTGTALGDPIEIDGLKQAFSHMSRTENTELSSDGASYCGLGSIKTNIGHLEAAAGLAGLLKVVLSLQHKMLPPSLHLQALNPRINLSASPFYVVREFQPWAPRPGQRLRRAAVGSFGSGGTNAYVVLEESPGSGDASGFRGGGSPVAKTSRGAERPFARELLARELSLGSKKAPTLQLPCHVVCLSAKTAEALRQREQDLVRWLEQKGPASSLAEISATLLVGREHFRYRSAYVVKTVEELQATIRQALVDESTQRRFHGGLRPTREYGSSQRDHEGQVLLRELSHWQGPEFAFEAKLCSLAELYVAGHDLDWKTLFGDLPVPRLHLPTYPFARERFWVPKVPDKPADLPVEEGEDEGAQTPVASQGELGEQGEQGLTLVYPVWREESVDEVEERSSVAEQTSRGTQHLVVLCESRASGVFQGILSDTTAGGVRVDRGRVDGIEPRLNGAKWVQLQWVGGSIADRYESYAVDAFREVQSMLRSGVIGKGSVLMQIVVLIREAEDKLVSGLVGLLRTAAREHPEFRGQLLEIEVGSNENPNLTADLMVKRLRENGPLLTDYVRYQDGKRWVLEWQEVHPLPAPKDGPALFEHKPWRDQGVYLITGGAGGLGMIFAREIARSANNPILILTGRSKLQEQHQTSLRQLVAMGTQVEYWQVDATDGAAMERLVQSIREKFGTLHGILHSAGVVQDNLLLKKTSDEWHSVLGPKVKGLMNLDYASQDLELDLFLLFSSWSAVTGNPGQADYATANAFMDAYAGYRNRLVASGKRHGRTLSINWPLWQEGGMKLDKETARRVERSLGMNPLQTQQGIQALYLGLAAKANRVLVRVNSPLTAARDKDALFTQVQEALLHLVSRLSKIKVQDLDVDAELGDYGFDSILFTALANELNDQFQLELSPAVFFVHSTLNELARCLISEYQIGKANSFRRSTTQALEASAAPLNPPQPGQCQPQLQAKGTPIPDRDEDNDEDNTGELIAIVGVSCQFPGANNLKEFWHQLKTGADCIREIPKDRWDWQSPYEGQFASNTTTLQWGAFIDGVDEFDALFFGISPSEAELMDPQHRLLLTHAWKAIEDAGYAAKDLSDTQTGVFTAIAGGGYSSLLLRAQAPIPGHYATGNMPSVGPNRISYFFNFHGPSEPVETACSSGLVAIHRAVSAILDGSCEMALAGGVNLILTPELHLSFEQAGMLSPDGRCKTFSAEADGYVRGEGVGMLLLKRLKDAKQAGDHVYAVIRSTAVNHGGRANSLTAPNAKAQTQLLVRAYKQAGIDPGTVTYIETHGTGTALGDPVEINALKTAFQQLMTTSETSSFSPPHCGLGSVKTNIGHLEFAAGIAGIIKVLLQLQHQTLVKNLHFTSINPYIQLADSPFYIVQENQEWLPVYDHNGRVLPRRAGVSSFGFGGANAHLVIEEYIADESDVLSPVMSPETPALVVLSAKRKQQLEEQVQRLLAYLEEHPLTNAGLADLAYTLQVGRESMQERLAIIAESSEELKQKLRDVLEGTNETSGIYRGGGQGHDELLTLLSDDAELQAVMEGWLKRGKYTHLVKLWVNGLQVDWQAFYRGQPRRRISLPTYPFARERYWVPRLGEKKSLHREEKPSPPGLSTRVAERRFSETLAKPRPLHPLLHERTLNFPEQRFRSTFTGKEFFLKDHVVRGQRILPGVTYLEMARAAAAQAMAGHDAGSMEVAPTSENALEGERTMRIGQVVLVRPFVVAEEPAEVQIRLTPPEDGRMAFEIYGTPKEGRGESVLYSQGRVELDSPAWTEGIDLPYLKSQCQASPLTAQQWYEILRATGFEFGPAHQGIRQIYVGQGQVLARLNLPEAVSETKDAFWLHPSVLDSALQASVALMAEIGIGGEVSVGGFLPFSLEEMQILDKSPTDAWAWIRDCDTPALAAETVRKLDIDVCNDEGRVCVRMKGLTLRSFEKIHHTLAPDTRDENLTLMPVWEPVPTDLTEDFVLSSTSQVVLIGATPEQRELVHVKAPHTEWLDLAAGDAIEDIEAYFERMGPIDQVFWFAPNEPPPLATDESILTSQNSGVLQVFKIIKALLRQNYELKRLSLNFVTTQTQQVCKTEPVNAAHSSILGLAGTLSKEFPNWRVQWFDVPAAEKCPLWELFSLSTREAGPGLAYRSGTWYQQKLLPVQTPSPGGEPPYRQGGVYVIVGGAGGLGGVWSEYIVRNYQAQVVWLGRRALDHEISTKMEHLSQFGPTPRYFTVDAQDLGALRRVYKTIKQEFPKIHGVVHSAVVLQDESLLNMSEERFGAVLQSKVHVSVRLAQVFQEEELDFMLFFSSLNSFLQTPGQSNYNAGCTFQDAFAGQLTQQGLCSAKVMNWGYWGQAGIVASPAYRKRMAAQGLGSIEPADAMAALDFLLAGPMNQLAFLKATPQLHFDMVAGEERVVIQSPSIKPQLASLKPRLAAIALERAELDMASRENEVAAALQQAAAECLAVNAEDIDLDVGLSEYGFDRVTLTQFINHIQKRWHVELTLSMVTQQATLRDLAEYLRTQLRTYKSRRNPNGGIAE